MNGCEDDADDDDRVGAEDEPWDDDLAEFGEVVTQRWSCCGQVGTGQKYGPCPNCGAI